MEYVEKKETIVTLIKVIHYNLDFRAREFPCDDEVYYPEVNKDGFPVYTIPKKLARMILVHHPDRYRLYRSMSLDISYTEPGTGANRYKKIHPWFYTKQTKQTGIDPENNEAIYGTVFVWFEDPHNHSVRSKKIEITPVKTLEPAEEPPTPELKPETAKESITLVVPPPVPVKVEVSFDSLKVLRDMAKKMIGDEEEKNAYKLMREKIDAKGPIPKKDDLPAAIDFYNNLIERYNAT